MMKYQIFLLLALFLFSCSAKNEQQETSPDGNLKVEFSVKEKGMPTYSVSYKNEAVILPSTMGFEFENDLKFMTDCKVLKVNHSNFSEQWEMPWGEKRWVDNNYQQMTVELKNSKTGMLVNVQFKVYNDGIGFRYEFPEQEKYSELIIQDENTQFNLTGDHKCWWIPGDWDIYEHLYNTTNFTAIDAISKRNNPNLGQTYIPENAVNTPVTMRTESGLHLSFHEADLTDYAGMTLKVDAENLSMTSELVGSDRFGYKVKRSMPFQTPWRTIQISDNATGLIESDLIENLNEPNKLGDVSWFKPTKYMGIWWEMHLGKSTWDIGGTQDAGSAAPGTKATGTRHGATTENAKAFIDFASEHNIGGLLVEGWNTGWEHWIGFRFCNSLSRLRFARSGSIRS
jgi:hypothetical protein